MTKDEFKHEMRNNTNEALLGLCLTDALVPHVFEPKPGNWDAFREHIAGQVGAAPDDVAIVGSARLGLSMKPGSNLRSFGDTSDIDVVVVNAALFDEIWMNLLAAAYPRPPATYLLGGWLGKRKNELYTGWVSPLEARLDRKIFGERAKPVLEFNARWFNALKSASQFPVLRHEDVNGRLYRTWQHAELYHTHSLSILRGTLDLDQ